MNVFPMPRIDDLLDQLSEKTVLSTLDAISGIEVEADNLDFHNCG